jgi:threonine synthase
MRVNGAAESPFVCTNCGRPYPSNGAPYRCQHCGGLFDFAEPLVYQPLTMPAEPTRGLGRYRRTFPLGDDDPFVSLGEGGTPLVPFRLEDRTIYAKCEHLNPTGSFKDRGTAVLVSALAADGATEAVEDSSGNAGASFAAYAARAGIHAKVFVPDDAAGPKRAQIESYGADLVRILGPRSAASEAVLRQVEGGALYASHAYLPHGLAGMATIAFEIYEQLGTAPGAVIAPVGQGTLFLGAYRGFLALQQAGRIEQLPKMIAVQAMACAPIWAVQAGGATGLLWTKERPTIAEGIRILHPLRGDAVLDALAKTAGWAIAVDEPEIEDGWHQLGQKGLFVEPTSSVVWPALLNAIGDLPDPVVIVLTGSGFKEPQAGRG